MKLRVSSSVWNFHDKLKNALGVEDYNPKTDRIEPTLFVGLYHWKDYIYFLAHKGPKKVFWCGSDILNLTERPIWRWLIRTQEAKHYCENNIEEDFLILNGIIGNKDGIVRYGDARAKIIPMLFDDIDKYEVSFQPSDKPQVYMNVHPSREDEYGENIIRYIADSVPDITFHIYGGDFPTAKANIHRHGLIPEEQFNEEIKNYQCGLRLNNFDGFSEITAKSILMGQYPITKIVYPHIDYAETTNELIILLEGLKDKKEPNPERLEWIRILKESKQELLNW
jgi:hypothetical protein